jgi:hypothetical protein|eukprot:COSAG06_NODE_31_length_31488_cov_60.882793_21_plen_879_part_00
MGTPRQPSAVAAALLVLLSCTAFYPHSAAARKSKDKAEAERLAEAVREHGGAGRWPESIEASLQAIALDPTSRGLFSDFSFTLTQVAAQPAATQQHVAHRLAEAVSGKDGRMPFVPALAAVYKSAAPFRDRAVAVAKQGVTIGCTPVGRNSPGGFGAGLETRGPAEQAEFGWFSVVMDALSQTSGAKLSASKLQGCASAVSRLASSADDTDPVASYVAGRLALAFEDKFNQAPGFPDVFNCGKNGVHVTLNTGGADQYLTGDSETFQRVILPVSLLAADVTVDSVDSLELARALFLGEEQGSPAGEGVLPTLQLRSKVVQIGAKACLDRAVRLQPQNLLGYYARGSLMGNLGGSSGAGTVRGLADFRKYLALDSAGKAAESHTIAFRAAVMTERLANLMIRDNLSLPDVLDKADGDLAHLLSFNSSVQVGGADHVARSRPIIEDEKKGAGPWQSLGELSRADLISELGEYASKLSRRSAEDPRANVLLAMKVFLTAKHQEASGNELSSDAKARTYREVTDLADQVLASADGLRGTSHQAALANSEWRAWVLKADAGLRYGEKDLARHVYSPGSLRPDGKTWSFTPSATCRAYETAGELAATALESSLIVKDAVAGYFASAARLMWLHKLIVPRGYNGWIGDQTPVQSEIVAKDITTPPHQTELWKRTSRNYGRALHFEPTNAESFIGKLIVDGEWLERWQRFHAPVPGAAPPTHDEDGPLPAGAYLTGDALKTKVSEFYEAFRHTVAEDSDHYITSSIKFVHEKAWTRPTNQPIDMVAVEEAIMLAPSAGLVLEFGVFEATTIRDLSLYMEQRHDELLAESELLLSDAAAPPPFLLNDIHGFDSFEGLPHDWDGRSGMKAGHFTLNGVIPPVFIECGF